VTEGVIGEKVFGLRSGDKGGIARNKDEGELVVSEEPVGAQGRRQLDSIIGLEGMLMCQICRCGKVICAQRHNRIAMGKLTHDATISPVPLCPLDPNQRAR
jgi:uridine phosphorylase